MMIDFEKTLEQYIEAAGSFEDIPWGTMYGQKMTLGTMTDEHVHNCIQYHKGLLMMAEVTPGMSHLIEEASFIVFMQEKNRDRRKETVDIHSESV
jgi:hypothetical protein